MRIIDPHLHLFDLQRGQYQWLRPGNPPNWPDKSLICRDFSQHDLALPSPFELCGFVHIEAGFDNHQSWREVQWLEESVSLPFKSIATVDLTWSDADFDACLDALKRFDSVVGVRHILDEQAAALLSLGQVQRNLTALAQRDWLFELQCSLRDNDAVAKVGEIAMAIPALQMVLNHAGFAPLTDGQNNACSLWRENLCQLGEISSVFCKVSGLEMTDRHYTAEQFATVVHDCIDGFGEQRVMLASNFPLCLFHSSYQEYWQRAASTVTLSALLNDNAARCYRFV